MDTQELSSIAAYIKNKPIRVPSQKIAEKELTWDKMEESERRHIATFYRRSAANAAELDYGDRMYKTLVNFYGTTASIRYGDKDMPNILNRGQLWYGDKTKFMRGEPSQCHRNSCRLWLNNEDSTLICTGYALSTDGVWREHSWLVWIRPRVNKIIETTTGRLAYFGYVMTPEECKQFVYENI